MHLDTTAFVKPAVLVVDDDPAVLQLWREALVDPRWDLRCAPSGFQALQLWDRSVRVLITDRQMSAISGDHLAAFLRHEDPTLRVIHVSGTLLGDESDTPMERFLQKPVYIQELRAALEQMLQGASPVLFGSSAGSSDSSFSVSS